MYKIAVKLISILPLLFVLSSNVSAKIISYNLSDKDPGVLALPDYGIRLDDLFTSPTESNWTFSFDGPGASVRMDIDTVAATARIHGTVVGGRDTGMSWDTLTIAMWNLDFTYSDNITINDPDAGYWSVATNANNFGWLELVTPVNLDGIAGTDEASFIALADYHGGSFIANGGPSPSSPYVSAWLESTDGFIDSNTNLPNENYVRPNGGNCCKDFSFRADPIPTIPLATVPEPSSLILMALGLFGVSITSRFKKKL